MRARLILEAGEGSPPSLDLLPGQPATLGRSRDNSIVLRDELASRMHAKVYYEDGRWVVRDFGLNGTRVGGARISGSIPLTEGSVIQIGETRLRFGLMQVERPNGSAEGLSHTAMVTPTQRNTTVEPVAGPRTAVFDLAGMQRSEQPSISSRTPVECGGTRAVPMSQVMGADASQRLKVDELTALCRYMTAAMDLDDTHELIRASLRAILHQTTARMVGYLSLDPADPTPRFILPEHSSVDLPLSRHLTDRMRSGRRLVWLTNDSVAVSDRLPSDSLQHFRDAICTPLTAGNETYAALHVYRTGAAFDERDVRFVEAVGGYLARALDLHRHRRKLEAENQRLRATMPTADELIGDSSAMMALRQQIARVAPQPFTVLIRGESGSGKELVAQALHGGSLRANGPMVVVNCAGIAPTLLEAELFGYRRGAFGGIEADRPGLLEQADEGTLFLDEVGELSLEGQAKLLRVIEGKPFRPVGGLVDVKVDVRVIAATSRNLDQDVKAGRFRQDLLFRLNVIPLNVPPLREHPEDVPELAKFFLERLSVQCRRPFRLAPQALRKLEQFNWPGNVRQLRAVLETAAVLCETDTIEAADIPLPGTNDTAPAADVPPSLDVDDLETWAIRKAMKQTHGNVSRAAQVLGISRDTLHTKLKKKNIDRGELLAELDR